MKKNKKINYYILDLNNAVTPVDWPVDIPKELKLKTGEHFYEFDIVESNESWYQSLVLFSNNRNRNKNLDTPIGLNPLNLLPGSIILDENKKIIYSGKNKEDFLAKEQAEKIKNQEKIKELKQLYPKIKDKYLIDFDETIKLFNLNENSDKNSIYNTFNDVFISGGGSTYSDGSLASLGAYSSIIDFDTLEQTLSVFNVNNLKLLHESMKEIDYLSPTFKVLSTFIEKKVENTSCKLKIK